MFKYSMSRIAFSGKKDAGKSTVTNFLVQSGYRELSLAGPLKELVIKLFVIDPKYVYDPDWKEVVIPELGVSGRQLCQTIGTECFRNELPRVLPELQLNRSIWIHSLIKSIERYSDQGEWKFVVSDCRFSDEYEALHDDGFTVIEIVRPGLDGACAHASEQGCPSDYRVVNSGTPEDLWAAVQKIMVGLIRP